MAQTLATTRTNVRNHIDEPDANYWTDSELNARISTSQLTLWGKIYALKKDYFLSPTGFVLNLSANKFKYETADGVPVDLFRVTAIRTTTSGFQDIVWRPSSPDSDEFQQGLNTDTPFTYPYDILYAIRNMNSIWVSPIPQQALTAQVDYIQLPTAVVNDTDTFLPVLDPFVDFIEYDAAAKALAKGPVGDVAYWEQRAMERWNNIAMSLDTTRQNQGPDLVRGFQEGW